VWRTVQGVYKRRLLPPVRGGWGVGVECGLGGYVEVDMGSDGGGWGNRSGRQEDFFFINSLLACILSSIWPGDASPGGDPAG